MKRRIMAIGIAVSLSCLAGTASAQVDTATIWGIVKDSSGAPLPGAQVTVTHVDTNYARTATSGVDGQYSFQFLPLGAYRIEAVMPQFKRFSQTGLVLEVNRNARVDPVLEIGQMQEVLEVAADAPLVETRSVSLGTTISADEVENLPLIDRDVYDLLELTPGVEASEKSNVFGSPGQETLINGSSNAGAGSVNYYLDGGNNTGGLRQTGNIAPNPDAVQEFRVVTNNYSAEYGRFAGGIIDVVTKSGSNDFKGSIFEYFRNERLNALPYTRGTTPARDPFQRNQFGMTFGGPLRENETFFFVSYSGLRRRETEYEFDTRVPTALERAGDFSATRSTAGLPVFIKDPVNPLPCVSPTATNAAGDSRGCFPGNKIPADRLDPTAMRIIQDYIPLPNRGENRYDASAPLPEDRDEFQIKVNQNLGSRHQLTASYFHNWGNTVETLQGDLKWVDRNFQWKQHNINIGDTWSVNASTTNQSRFTYVRSFGGRVNTPQVSIADLGSKFVMQGTPTLPEISVSGFFELGVDLAGPVAGSNLYQLRDVLSVVKGKHSIRMGGEASLEKIVHDANLTNYGDWNFDGRRTNLGISDFMMGLPASFAQDAPITKVDNGWYFGLFAQDDFKIHPRVTLNLGVRYDLQLPFTDTLDRKLTFSPGAQSTVVPTAPAGLLFVGDTLNGERIGRGIANPDLNNFAPRIGVAWDVRGDGRTAVRSAFGIFYGTIGGNMWNMPADRQPFSIRQSFPNVFTFSDPYRNMPVVPFPYYWDPASPRFITPADISAIDPVFEIPYTMQTNFSVSQQIGKGSSITVSYVGALGRKLPMNINENYPQPSPAATSANINSRRLYRPTFGNINVLHSMLNTAHHSMQVTGEKRIGRTFQLKGSYVFGKSIEGASLQGDGTGAVQDQWNIRADRARTGNGRRHNLVMSFIWRTRKVGFGPPVLRAVVSDWTMSAIGSLRSGRPFTVRANRDTNFDGTNATDRADRIPGADITLPGDRSKQEKMARWFNTEAFSMPVDGTSGTSARNLIEGPGSRNVDLQVSRDFRMPRKTTLQLRVLATNAFNFVNLSNPEARITQGNFGQITSAGRMRQMQLGAKLSF
jgi:hypothetical protein